MTGTDDVRHSRDNNI